MAGNKGRRTLRNDHYDPPAFQQGKTAYEKELENKIGRLETRITGLESTIRKLKSERGVAT